MKEIISSLDIGSSTVKLVVCEVYKNETNVLAVYEVKSKGIKKGLIVNPEETLISLREVFSRCEDMLNIKVNKVLLTIPSYYAEFLMTEAKIDITNEDGIIDGDDIVNVLQTCVYNKIPNNKELVGGFSKELIRRVCVGPQMYNDRDYENRKRLEAIKDKEKVRMEIENLFSGNREIFEAYAKDHPEVLTEGKVKTDVEWNGEYVRYLSYIYLYFKK